MQRVIIKFVLPAGIVLLMLVLTILNWPDHEARYEKCRSDFTARTDCFNATPSAETCLKLIENYCGKP